jgi:hypothetical protein
MKSSNNLCGPIKNKMTSAVILKVVLFMSISKISRLVVDFLNI